MTHVALLRGINVGGRNKVEMRRLREVLAGIGLRDVRTYIASGNVVFSTRRRSATRLAADIARAIEAGFGFPVAVLVRDAGAITRIAAAIPEGWANDDATKCDVLYLWDRADRPEVLEQLPIREGIDEARYVPGAVIWKLDRAMATRSGLPRIVGTDLYQQMTVRNCRTARKLAELVDASS